MKLIAVGNDGDSSGSQVRVSSSRSNGVGSSPLSLSLSHSVGWPTSAHGRSEQGQKVLSLFFSADRPGLGCGCGHCSEGLLSSISRFGRMKGPSPAEHITNVIASAPLRIVQLLRLPLPPPK